MKNLPEIMRQKRQLRTAAGHVYVVATSPAGPVKVGVAADPKKRVRALECATGTRFSQVWISPQRACVRAIEAQAHRHMQPSRTVGEWFNVPFDVAVTLARDLTAARKRSRRIGVVPSDHPPVSPAAPEAAESPMDQVARAAVPLLLDFLEREGRAA